MITPIGLATFALMVAMFLYFAKALSLGALSLPCITALTSTIYFYIMPTLSLAGGNYEFFGYILTSLEGAHLAVFLYMLGVGAACMAGMRHLTVNPAAPLKQERKLNPIALILLWGIAAAGAVILVASGKVNILADQDFQFSDTKDFLFLNMSFSMLIPLTLMVLVRNNFGPVSLAILVVVLLVLTQTGFRFRIMILLCSVMAAFAMSKGLKLRALYIVPGTVVALIFVNAFGMSRKYGNGVNLSIIQGMSWDEILTGFGGEVGPVFVLEAFCEKSLPSPVFFDPWIIGIARMVPSNIWPDKPAVDYLSSAYDSFGSSDMGGAGVAVTQHMELLMQFGWFGLPFLSALYFGIAIYLISKFNVLSREVRIAGCALLPPFFGFFMQQRGYFFMTFSEGLFMIGPLFLVHLGERRPRRKRQELQGYGRMAGAVRRHGAQGQPPSAELRRDLPS